MSLFLDEDFHGTCFLDLHKHCYDYRYKNKGEIQISAYHWHELTSNKTMASFTRIWCIGYIRIPFLWIFTAKTIAWHKGLEAWRKKSQINNHFVYFTYVTALMECILIPPPAPPNWTIVLTPAPWERNWKQLGSAISLSLASWIISPMGQGPLTPHTAGKTAYK